MFLPLITYFINLLTILLSLCSYNQRFKDKTKQLLYFLLIAYSGGYPFSISGDIRSLPS